MNYTKKPLQGRKRLLAMDYAVRDSEEKVLAAILPPDQYKVFKGKSFNLGNFNKEEVTIKFWGCQDEDLKAIKAKVSLDNDIFCFTYKIMPGAYERWEKACGSTCKGSDYNRRLMSAIDFSLMPVV